MASTCPHCVAAGVDPKRATFDDAEEFDKHLAKKHPVEDPEESGHGHHDHHDHQTPRHKK